MTILGPLSGNTDAASVPESVPGEYRKVTESDSYELYLYEDTMSVILRNKATGVIMRSTLDPADDDGNNNMTWMGYMQSGIVLTAIQGTVDTHQVDLIGNSKTIEYTYTTNGFIAKIYFPQWRFGLTVHVTLEGSEFVVSVPDNSIIENDPNCFIGTISLFPFMGYTYLDSHDGYMLIPDGNGALIYLDNKHKRYSTGFSQMIYGDDAGFVKSSSEVFLRDTFRMVEEPGKVVMPVFGMAHTGKQIAYLAIVEEGDKQAGIQAHPNGVMVDYNRCFARFLVRRVYIQPLNNSNSGTIPMVEESRAHSDMTVRYVLLSGSDANYVGMGVAYRDYLLKNDLIRMKDTAYRTRVDFLGTDREQFLFGTRAVTMTTVGNVEEMYGYFRTAGIDSLLSVYIGWQRGGVYRVPVNSYNADRAIGGTSKLTQLIHDASEHNYRVYLYNDALRINTDTNFAAFNTIRMINKRRFELDTRQRVYRNFSYLLPEITAQTLERFAKSYRKEGLSNLALTQITGNLFSYSNSGRFYSRYHTGASHQNTIASLSEEMNLIMEAPFAYLWKYTDAYLEMPLGSSYYMYQDESVPFMSIVLKGIIPMYSDYVNFEANKNEFKLKMIEAGIYPSFYLTYRDSADLIYTNSSHLYSTLYDTHKETIVEYDRVFRALAGATGDAFITGHQKLTDSISVTSYDNGVHIYVNYSTDAVTLDSSFGIHSGIIVPALDATVSLLHKDGN